MEMSICKRNTPCVLCNDKCLHAGDIGADCPYYHCINEPAGTCENCLAVRGYIYEVYGTSPEELRKAIEHEKKKKKSARIRL